jgi:DNA segregation ATPase FtsK/SpoIIIE, S-DNA-T family
VAFVRLEADPDPVRVRAGWVTDGDIRDMADTCADDAVPLPELEGVVVAWPRLRSG